MRAETELAYQGFSVYLPKISKVKRLRGQWKRQIAAMFPRYLFLQPGHAEQPIAPVNSTRGVTYLVRHGKSLVVCPEALIDSIRNVEAQLNGEASGLFVAVG